ncbi:NADP-dependent oxidoreductase [Allostreptomyces psammosilenae]|uniref:NADPH:quinone reductase-like Zn-dependent oxidoreductase n=1 Tax=Allostreptomyces psammosilenae TaxID=1892865 RepID=A0A852ZUQ8_9ACTN|nr:NADP-dependent oxidoreductase [Allostreptomyces psammosilenae]NYI05655.1 NADPH:quinone reductase-like Zn-dependent oxidoreductase [Allostreptomyces psammosilenae]
MLAAYIERYGNNGVVRVGDRPQPQPGPRDLLVKVRAASVNPVDVFTRNGRMRPLLPYPLPLTLGSDLSGEVVAVGPEVTAFRAGDEVYARLHERRIGAFAEYALVREADAAPKPAGLNHVEAASIPLVALTAWQALTEHGRVRQGQHVLVHAGSGGVGSMAIQLARHLGARVSTTVSARNAELARDLGAETVVDYRTERFEERVGEVDFVLDTVGGGVRRRSFGVLRRGGAMTTIFGTPTAQVGRDLNAAVPVRMAMGLAHAGNFALARRRGVGFSYLFVRADGAQLRELAGLVEKGAVRPVVEQVFPLERVPEALAVSESGRVTGKLVIEMP